MNSSQLCELCTMTNPSKKKYKLQIGRPDLNLVL